MAEFFGKICPYCNTEIREWDQVKVCPSCGVAHHEACWNQYRGCSTPGCPEQYVDPQYQQYTEPQYQQYTEPQYQQYTEPQYQQYTEPQYQQYTEPQYQQYTDPRYQQYTEPRYQQYTEPQYQQYTNPQYQQYTEPQYATSPASPTDSLAGNVCSGCGTPISGDQKFCPVCGTPAPVQPRRKCNNCGTELADDQVFCPTCGMRVDLQVSSNVTEAINQLNSDVAKDKKKKKKTPLIIGIVSAVVVAAVVLLLVLGGGSGPKIAKTALSDIYNQYCQGQNWAQISEDGKTLSLDDNPYDLEKYWIDDADDAIKTINKELGFDDSLFEDMCNTTYNDGEKTRSNDKVTVSWTFHPNKGLEVKYTLK